MSRLLQSGRFGVLTPLALSVPRLEPARVSSQLRRNTVRLAKTYLPCRDPITCVAMNCSVCASPLPPSADGGFSARCLACGTESGGGSGDPSQDARLAEAVEAFQTAAKAGDPLDIDVFCGRYPILGESLRDALEMQQQLDRIDSDVGGVPERLGRYRLIEPLGRGGAALIFRARDTGLGHDVALKVLPPDALRGAAHQRRFLREARALAAVRHPHVVPIHDVGEDGPFCYIVMPLMRDSLARMVGERVGAGERAARTRQVVDHILEAASGLAAAHARGILHRDVKPANLLVDTDGRVCVADFGLAWRVGDETLTAAGHGVGTPGFVAPEQARGEPPTTASDVYGLGATLYQLLLGTTPVIVSQAGPTVPPELPKPLRLVLTRSLAPQADQRYPDVTSFAQDLRLFYQHASVWRWLAYARPIAAPALIVLAAAFGALVGALLLAPESPPSESLRPKLTQASGYLLWRGGPAELRTSPLRITASMGSIEPDGDPWIWLIGPKPESRAQTTPCGPGLNAQLDLEDFAATLELQTTRTGATVARLPLDVHALGVVEAWRMRSQCVDVDGDARADVVLVRGNQEAAVFKWDPHAEFAVRYPAWSMRLNHRFGYGSPVLADWDLDGREEILVGDAGRDLVTGEQTYVSGFYLIDADTAKIHRVWTLDGSIRSTPQLRPSSSAPRAYIDTTSSDESATRSGHLYGIGPATAGRPAPLGRPRGQGWRGHGVVLVDVDADGEAELIFGGDDGRVHCVRPEKPEEPLWTFTGQMRTRTTSHPLLTQQDGDDRLEVCLWSGHAFSCLRTDLDLADEARLVWEAQLDPNASKPSHRPATFCTQPPIELPDLTGDGMAELACGTVSGRLVVLSRQAPGGVLLDQAVATEESGGGGFIARLVAHLEEDLQLWGATANGQVIAWRYVDGGLVEQWRFDVGGRVIASPRLIERVDDDGRSLGVGVLVASYSGWLHLLEGPASGAGAPRVVWSLRARGAVGSTPAIRRDQGIMWIVFTDELGYLYRVWMSLDLLGPR